MNIKKKQEGFTIIEVMIVLAIAGLIMVVALIAIPQLQRNQRNNARQAVLSRMSTEIGNYAGNNNGQIPGASDMIGFYERYLNDVNTEDPRTGDKIPMLYTTIGGAGLPALSDEAPDSVTYNSDGIPTGFTGSGNLGIAYYAPDSACDGENVSTGAGNRSFALVTVLEGGAIYCLDNS